MNNSTPLECAVYKSQKKDDTYVFIPTQNPLSELPEALLKMLGQAELVMTLELTPEKKMARGTAEKILKDIKEQGFHLQMPESTHFTGIPSYKESLKKPG